MNRRTERDWFKVIPEEARLTPSLLSGISRPAGADPDHRLAWSEVASGEADYAEVVSRDYKVVLFRAWRISQTSWAWQSASMAAPAFEGYVDA